MSLNTNRPLISIANFGKTFTLHHLQRQLNACSDIHFDLYSGQFLGITGKSGSGKSTILKSIYRTYLPDRGTILYDSLAFGLVDLTKVSERQIIYLRKREIGYVSQFLNVMPRQKARDIVERAVIEAGEPQRSAKEQAEAMLSFFQLDPTLWDHYPNNFSGGEKLRLNVAAAMIKKPRLLLLDEPTASLDLASKMKVRTLIEQLKAEGTTMIGIFHDLEFMEGLCDITFNMEKKAENY